MVMTAEQELLAQFRFIRAYGQIRWAQSPDNADELEQTWSALVAHSGSLAHLLADLDQAIDSLTETAEQSKIWAPAVIAEVRPGDRIRIAGNSESAAVVEGVSPLLRWHVHPAANPYHPEESRAEWSELKVRFEGRAELVSFTKPDFPIEIETTQLEADAVQLLGGWGARVIA
jgi:hypothetical protein